MKVAKSDAKAPETNKVNEVKMEPVILLDSEEERVDPSRGSKDGGNPCYSRRGKSEAKADNMHGVKKEVVKTKEAKKAAKDPEKHFLILRLVVCASGLK
uniref:Uncharacterized protein n=1 Tax=Solanum lycopersicum TaxID=4081 RepID=A0A3Q7FKR0_SOLLC